MNKKQKKAIKAAIGHVAHVVTFHGDDTVTAKRSFYWRSQGADMMDKVLALVPGAVEIGRGSKMRPFIGGVKTCGAEDSYHWIKFRVEPTAAPVVDCPSPVTSK